MTSPEVPPFSINETQKWVNFLQNEGASANIKLMQDRRRRDLYFGCFLTALALTVVNVALAIFSYIKTSPYALAGAGLLVTSFLAVKYRKWSWIYHSGFFSLGADLERNLVPILLNQVYTQDLSMKDLLFNSFATTIEKIIGNNNLTTNQLGLVYCYFQDIGHTNMDPDPNENEQRINKDLQTYWKTLLSELKIPEPDSYAANMELLKSIRPARTSFHESQRDRILLANKCRAPALEENTVTI